MIKRVQVIFYCLVFSILCQAQLPYPLPVNVDTSQFGRKIQRTMRLLATSTPTKRNTVKIMVYGQSIAKQEWSDSVRLYIKKKYPYAHLIMINRSIGGCWAGCLEDYVAYDIKTFYPDLILFDVYGWGQWGGDQGNQYENILNYIRTNTTAEIGMQNHHVTGTEFRNENSGGARYFEELATKYGIELIDVRTRWLQYLNDNNVANANDLTTDGTHLNQWGNFLMARLYRPYLNYKSNWASDTFGLVKTYVVGQDIFAVNGKITLPFNGSKVDLVHASPVPNMDSAAVFIDNKRPSTIAGNVMFTRPNDGYDTIFRHYPAVDFPWQTGTIAKFENPTSLLKAQNWTLSFVTYNANVNFTYNVSGSATGNDGSGSSNIDNNYNTSGADFNSTSGQVRFLNDKFYFNNGPYAPLPLAPGYTIKWQAKAFYTDTFCPTTISGGAIDSVSVLAQGLTNDNHTLVLDAKGNKNTPIKEIRIYRPFFNRTNPNFTITAPNLITKNPPSTCAGAFIDLTKTFVDTKSITGIVTYWANALATISVTSPNMVSVAGVYYIKKQAIVAGISDIKPVTVLGFNICNPNLVVTNPAASCLGSTANITSTFVDANGVAGSISYWSNATATVVLPNPTSVSVPGIYYIKKTSAINGSSDTKAVSVFGINCQPNLSISQPSPICEGNTINITSLFTDVNSVAGTVTYWTNAAATTTLIGANAVSISGTYYIKKNHTSGLSDTKPINVTVNSLPIITVKTPQNICAGNIANITALGANSYAWYPGNVSGNSISVSPLTNTNYTVRGTSLQGCSKTNIFNFTVLSTPIFNISGATSICTGNATTLTSTGTNSYQWFPGGLAGQIQSFNPSTNTNYTVVGTDLNGCKASRLFTISVSGSPALAINGTKNVCQGASTTLVATGTNSFTWMPGSIAGATLVANPSSTTTYTVIGYNNPTCQNTAFVTITVDALPMVSINGIMSICANQNTTITGSGANGYTWFPNSMVGTNQVLAPISTTNYTVVGTNSFGCNNSMLFTITVNALPLVSTTGKKSICINESTTISGTGANSYTWLPDNSTNNSVILNPISTTNYTLIGVNSKNCINHHIFTLTVFGLPNVVATTSGAVCSGLTAYLSATGASSYTWMPGNLTGQNINQILTDSKSYTVTGTDINGCKKTTLVDQIINPLPIVTISGNMKICEGKSTTITTTGAPFVLYQPGGFINLATTLNPTTTTTYTVKSTSSSGCFTFSNFTITVLSAPKIGATTTGAVCIGALASITGFGAITYSWMPGSFVGQTINPLVTAATIFSITGTDANGCTSNSVVNQTIFQHPIFTINGSNTICNGEATTLTSTGTNSYQWFPGGLAGQIQSFNPSINTNYTVVGTDLNGCKASRLFTISVSGSPALAINGTKNVCQGASTTLVATGTNSFTWMPGSIAGATLVANPSSTTTYTVIGYNNPTCQNTAFVTITVYLDARQYSRSYFGSQP